MLLFRYVPILIAIRKIQRVPALRAFWDLEKTVLNEIRVSGTVLWSPTSAKSPTYRYISQNRVSGNCKLDTITCTLLAVRILPFPINLKS